MSTWFKDLQQTDQKLAEAYKVVGAGQTRDALIRMIWVLQLLGRRNTPEDTRRLRAAQYIIGQTRGL